jgi:hypothetical protein
MKTILVGLLPHVLASVICVVIFTATPIVLYGLIVVISMIANGDMGGPLNFIIVPVFSVILALFTTFILLLPITATLQWISSRLKFSRWIPLIGIFPASFAVFSVVTFTIFKPENVNLTLMLLLVWCVIGSICFALYWIPLNIAETLLNWPFKLRRRSLP